MFVKYLLKRIIFERVINVYSGTIEFIESEKLVSVTSLIWTLNMDDN